MAATDYVTQVHDRLWELLEAHSPFAIAFKPGNRIKVVAGKAFPFKPVHKGDTDVPEAMLVLGDFSDQTFTEASTYRNATALPAAAPSVALWTEEYRLVITHRDANFGLASQQIMEIRTALRKGGPRLGLGFVWNWGPLSGSRQIIAEAVDEIGELAGTRRLVTTLRIPVTFRFHNGELLT